MSSINQIAGMAGACNNQPLSKKSQHSSAGPQSCAWLADVDDDAAASHRRVHDAVRTSTLFRPAYADPAAAKSAAEALAILSAWRCHNIPTEAKKAHTQASSPNASQEDLAWLAAEHDDNDLDEDIADEAYSSDDDDPSGQGGPSSSESNPGFLWPQPRRLFRRKGDTVTRDVVQLADNVLAELSDMEMEVDAMREKVGPARLRLAAVHRQVRSFVADSLAARAELQALEKRESDLRKVLHAVALSDDEMALLASPGALAADLSPSFFSALDHALQLDILARNVLDYPNAPLAVDIVEMCAVHLEAAYDRMYAWAQSKLPVLASGVRVMANANANTPESIGSSDSLTVLSTDAPSLPPWAYTLAKVCDRLSRGRPVVLRALLDQISAQRFTALGRAAERWWGRGSEAAVGFSPANSIDAVFAQVLAAVVTERTLWMAMLENSDTAGPANLPFSPIAPVPQTLLTAEAPLTPAAMAFEITEQASGALIKPLETKVHNALIAAAASSGRSGNPNAIGSLRDLAAPFLVHQRVFQNETRLREMGGLSDDCSLMVAIRDLRIMAMRQFMELLDAYVRAMLQSPSLPTADLEPTPSLIATCDLIATLADQAGGLSTPGASPTKFGSPRTQADDRSVALSDDSASRAEASVSQVLDLIIDPSVQGCVVAAGKLTSSMGNVFLLNSLERLMVVLSPISSTKVEALARQANIYMDSLAGEQLQELVASAGLEDILEALDHNPNNEALGTLLGLSTAPTLAHVSNQVEKVLLHGVRQSSVVVQSLDRLNRQDWTEIIHRDTLRQFLLIYRRLYDSVYDPRNPTDVQAVQLRSPEEVETLISL